MQQARTMLVRSAALVVALSPIIGCATDLEQRSGVDFRHTRVPGAETSKVQPGVRQQRASPARRQELLDGSLDAYIAYALEHSPALRATYQEWKAAVHRIAQARRLPEPTLTYAYFVRSVETRVGPQRHRFGISQAFPWPTKLTAGADAASLAARSAQRRFDAAALGVARRVAVAYFKLWRLDRERQVQQDQQNILQQFSATARGRVEVGQANFADIAQIDLSVSRIADVLSGLREAKRAAQAELLAAIGAPPDMDTPVLDEAPAATLPAEDLQALRQAAQSHPRIRAMAFMAESKQQGARSAEAERYPGFMLGADYIETGEAAMPGVADSGKDPILVMLSVRVPVWLGAYRAAEQQALAESAAFHAHEAAARDDATAQLAEVLTQIRDAARRVLLYRQTLIPQAQSVYEAVLGGYQSGRSTLASVLMAQRDLLELQLGMFRAHAEHATAWARLEEIVGRAVRPKPAQ